MNFDMFYRKNPDNGGFVLFAGLQQAIEAIKDMRFTEGDIEYLRSLDKFDEEFVDYLRNFKFTGTIYSVKEGTPVFPYEPLITVKAKLIEAQLIETFLLVTVNHQSLIATKTHRIVQEAKGRDVFEFGARRAQGYDGAHYGARAAYIAGVNGTATVSAAKEFGIPLVLVDVKKINEKASRKHDMRERLETAIETYNINEMRQISNTFFLRSGIYSRLCRYMAFLYRYDWMVTPICVDEKVKNEKVIDFEILEKI